MIWQSPHPVPENQRARLMRESIGPDRTWTATWTMLSGHHLRSTLDLDMTERLTRMDVPTEEQSEQGASPRHEWKGEDPVGPLREPLPNGRGPHWLEQLRDAWLGILFGTGPARW